jgi:3-isopropylmalate/(R)-2-methylmalate dehydratase small subunit
MQNIISGKALKYGDNINTDIISPPQFMELSIAEAAKYAMSSLDPEFYKKAGPSVIFVAGRNLGSGSSRETSPLTLQYFGIRVIIAVTFARIFYRNCINLGLIALECPDAVNIADGDALEVNYSAGGISNLSRRVTYACPAMPEHMLELIRRGGLAAYLKHSLPYARDGADGRGSA